MNEYVELARNAIQVARPAIEAGGAVAASVAGCAVWDWMKARLSGGARAEALHEVEEHPELETKWAILEANLADMLSEQADMREELEELLQGTGRTTQSANVTGNGNTVIQQSGQGNIVNRG